LLNGITNLSIESVPTRVLYTGLSFIMMLMYERALSSTCDGSINNTILLPFISTEGSILTKYDAELLTPLIISSLWPNDRNETMLCPEEILPRNSRNKNRGAILFILYLI